MVTTELDQPWAKKLDALPDELFVDENSEESERIAKLTRKELAQGLRTLTKWVADAKQKKLDLLLIMDGDQ